MSYYNANYKMPATPYNNGINSGMNIGTGSGVKPDTGGLFDWLGNNPGGAMVGAGSLMNGLGGLWGASLAKDYYSDTSDLMDKQMGLYESELNRRNNTRQSYGNAFSGA